MNKKEAIDIAKSNNLDLIEISPSADPPVCKIGDYGKFIYTQKKKLQNIKKKIQQIKIIKYRPATEESDYKNKFKNLLKFLETGDKVKVIVFFKGREFKFKEFGMEIIKRIVEDIDNIAVVEQEAKMEGRKLGMLIAPIPKK